MWYIGGQETQYREIGRNTGLSGDGPWRWSVCQRPLSNWDCTVAVLMLYTSLWMKRNTVRFVENLDKN